jgi:hypothetical protein
MGIIKVEDSTDTGMPGAFYDNHILIACNLFEVAGNTLFQHVMMRIVDIAARELSVDRNRAHILYIVIAPVHIPHQYGIGIDPVPVDFHVPLPDRFNESQAFIPFAENAHQSDTGGRFPVILAGSRDINPRDRCFNM